MTAITLFPFANGMQTHIDARLLPDGALVAARNVQLDRQGRLVGRGAFEDVAMTVLDPDALSTATFEAFDLFILNARLFALGDVDGAGYPADLYELLPSGLAAQWRASSSIDQAFTRLPRATRVRDMARPPDVDGGVLNMGCAAGGGFAALVWNSSDVNELGYASVFVAETGQPVVFTRLSSTAVPLYKRLRVLAVDDRFLFLGLSFAGTAINLARWIVASDQGISAVAINLLSGGAITVYAACRVAGSNEFCLVADIAGTVTLKRFNASGVEQVPSGGAYSTVAAVATRLAVEASSTANQITIAMVVGGEARLFSYNLATGAQIGAGPFVPFSGETSLEVSLVRVSSTVLEVVSSVTSEPAPTVFSRRYTVSTNTFGASLRAVTDAQLTTSAVFSGDVFFGIRVGAATVGNTPNMLVAHNTDADEVRPEIVKDLEIAGTVSQLLPDIAFDASTGKYYWANASANPDGDQAPILTEFELTSTARRQTAQFGNHVYIAGGAPLVFDGLTAVESGFQTRPRIISLTGSNGAGELLNSATYRYRAHWEWIDSEGDLHLGPPSAIVSVTLGASDDTITALVTSPHSMRRNRSANESVVRCVLSRTLATVDNEPAVASGTAIVTPPSSSLTGLTLKLFIVDSLGFTAFTVTFSVAAITSTVIASEINAVTSARVTAAHDGELIQLTSVGTGSAVTLAILASGTANVILGFAATTTLYRGSTTRTVGENFQRTATATSNDIDPLVDPRPVAAYVTVTDLRKDQTSPTILDSDLIRQQVLYSQGNASGAHHAPPPGECVAVGRERVVVAKQPRRSRYTASKLIVPAEPAEFAYEGVLAYSGLVTGDIEAVAVLGDTVILWTRRQIWAVTGNGPDRAGTGTFIAAQLLSRSIGIASPDGWRSLCEDDMGVWFQGSDNQIYRMGRGGSVEPLGNEVQDVMDTYPVVTAAVYVPTKRELAFAVTTDDGAGGAILRYRGESKAWFIDEGSDIGPCASLAEYQGRLVTVQAGGVQIQAEAPGVGIQYEVDTGMFQGFSVLGYGQLRQVGALATYRGPCTFEIFSSPDGTDYSTLLGSWPLTDAEYDVGDRIPLMVSPAVQQIDQFALRFRVTPAADSEGVWLHAAAVDTERQPGFTRQGASHNL